MKENFDVFITKLGKINLVRNISKIQKLCDTPHLTQVKLGFIGLNTTNEIAVDILEWVIRCEGYGLVIPTIYRDPKISVVKAKEIAIIELEKEIELSYPNIKFQAVQVFEDEPLWWRVCAYSEELTRRGLIPGGVCKYVDKLDGHLWPLADRVRVHKEEFYLDISIKVTIRQLEKSFKKELGYIESLDYSDHNIKCLRYGCLLIRLQPSPYPRLVEKLHGFSPNIHVHIKKIPYGKEYKNSTHLILKLILHIINYDAINLALTSDRGNLIKILEYKLGKLSLNNLVEDWSTHNQLLSSYNLEEKEIPPLKLPFAK